MAEDEKPWKTDLARKAAQRREQVVHELEEMIRKAPSFEDALRQAAELMKRRFARYTGVAVYVADGEDLAVHTSLDRPAGPDRVGAAGGSALGDAAHAPGATVVPDVANQAAWGGVGLTKGSVAVAPVRTEAGLWAMIEVWSEFRDAFTPSDVKLLERVTGALGRKTPAA